MGVMSDRTAGSSSETKRPQNAEQLFGPLDGLRIGTVQPVKARRVPDAEGMQQQNNLGQIAPLNLRRIALRPVEMPALRPEPVADPRRRPPRPPRPLLRRGAADRLDQQGADAALGS